MRVVFFGGCSMGPRYIMGVLKREGHQAFGIYQGYESQFIGERCAGFHDPISKEALARLQPTLFGISVDSGSHRTCSEISTRLKRDFPGVPVIWGGVHPTLFTEACLHESAVDYVCRDEGEYATLELCRALDGGQSPARIPNLYLKQDGRVVSNPSRDYVQNLDELPFDREGLNYNGIFTGRGCAGVCTFCATPAMKKAGPRSRYFRHHSVARVIREMKQLNRIRRRELLLDVMRARSPRSFARAIKHLIWDWFAPIRIKDDSFLVTKDWFLDYAKAFVRHFWITGYTCNARCNEIDEEVVRWMKRSRCKMVQLGFESGDEYYRSKVLKKFISDAQIEKAVRLLKEAEITILGQWMIGMPGETPRMALKSLRMATEIGGVQQIHIAVPFPATEMHTQAVEAGMIPPDFIPDGNIYNDFLFHKGAERDLFRVIYTLFSIAQTRVPANLETINFLSRFSYMKNETLGELLGALAELSSEEAASTVKISKAPGKTAFKELPVLRV